MKKTAKTKKVVAKAKATTKPNVNKKAKPRLEVHAVGNFKYAVQGHEAIRAFADSLDLTARVSRKKFGHKVKVYSEKAGDLDSIQKQFPGGTVRELKRKGNPTPTLIYLIGDEKSK